MRKRKTRLLLFLTLCSIFGSILLAFLIIKDHNQRQTIARKIVDHCTNPLKWRTCYADKFGGLTTSYGFDFAIDVMHEFQKIEPKARDCHFIAHKISFAEITSNPQKWEDFLSRAPADECIGGFIHGALEAYRRNDPTVELDAERVEKICSLTKTRGKSYCSHMMGHLLPVETDGDFKTAIDICKGLSGDIQYNCFTGVFMENITRDNLNYHGLAKHVPYNEESTAAQEQLCRQFSGEPARGCWQEITHYYQRLELGNPKGLFERCNRANNAESRDSCFLHGVTFMAGAEDLKGNDIISLCSPFSLDQEKRTKRCISTIIFVLLKSSPKFEERVKELCRRIEPEPKYQQFCTEKLSDAKSRILEPENIDLESQ